MSQGIILSGVGNDPIEVLLVKIVTLYAVILARMFIIYHLSFII